MTDKLQFVPNRLQAAVGTLTLAVRNEGRIPHNLVFDTAGLGSLGRVDGGRDATLRVRFTKAGTYRFECTFHPGMNGQVVVREARS
jgi:plastocyanin